MQNVAHILKGVLINYLVIEGGFPSEILFIYGNIRCFFEILKMLICNFLADSAQCEPYPTGSPEAHCIFLDFTYRLSCHERSKKLPVTKKINRDLRLPPHHSPARVW